MIAEIKKADPAASVLTSRLCHPHGNKADAGLTRALISITDFLVIFKEKLKMTTRALEDAEIKAIFDHISGWNAQRNEMLLIVGIGMALRASELVGLQVGDVYDRKKVKSYVTIRGETAKFSKGREVRTIGDW